MSHRRQRHLNPRSCGATLAFDATFSPSYDATSGGNAVAVGGTVARWEDMTSGARHATQATSAAQPTLQNGIAGNRCLAFSESGTIDRLDFGNPHTGTSCIVMVTAATSDSVYLTVGSASPNAWWENCDGSATSPFSNAGTPTYVLCGTALSSPTRVSLRTARGTGAHVLRGTGVTMMAASLNLCGYTISVYAFTGNMYAVTYMPASTAEPLLRRLEHSLAFRLKFSCN